jgi:hypothetical protein
MDSTVVVLAALKSQHRRSHELLPLPSIRTALKARGERLVENRPMEVGRMVTKGDMQS